MRYGFGVDVFGPNIKFGFFDETGELIEKWKIAAPILQTGSQLLPTIAEEIEQHSRKYHIHEDQIIGVGVGIPGPVNSAGVVNKCVNFGWGIFNIDHALSGLTGLNVKSSNIANLSALGECWKGNGSKNMVFMGMNTGLGGGIVCDGKLIFGAHGGAGEIGHIIINPQETEPCSCGKYGCVEQYCSPAGITRVARRQLADSRQPSSLRFRRRFDYKDVLQAAADGDPIAKATMNQIYDYTGRVLAHICCVSNPETIVLGGEFCKIGKSAMDGIARSFRKNVFHANEAVRFQFAALDTDACIYGAFKLILDTFTI